MAKGKDKNKRRPRPKPVEFAPPLLSLALGGFAGLALEQWAPKRTGLVLGSVTMMGAGTKMVPKKHKLNVFLFGAGAAAPGALDYGREALPMLGKGDEEAGRQDEEEESAPLTAAMQRLEAIEELIIKAAANDRADTFEAGGSADWDEAGGGSASGSDWDNAANW